MHHMPEPRQQSFFNDCFVPISNLYLADTLVYTPPSRVDAAVDVSFQLEIEFLNSTGSSAR